MRLAKRLSKQSRRRCFETPSCSWWRHCNATITRSNIRVNIQRHKVRFLLMTRLNKSREPCQKTITTQMYEPIIWNYYPENHFHIINELFLELCLVPILASWQPHIQVCHVVWNKVCVILQTTSSNAFCRKNSYFESNFIEVVLTGPTDNNIVSENGFAQIRRQAIAWT